MKWTPSKLAFVFILFVGITVIIGFVASPFTGDLVAPPNPPAGVMIFTETKRLPVTERDPAEWKKGYQVKQFIRLTSGEIIAPILQVERPRFRGPGGSVRAELVLESTFHFLGEGQAHIHIPLADDIDQFAILIRRLEGRGALGDDPWRFWQVSPKEVSNGFVMPNIETLGLFRDRKDATDLLEREDRLKEYQARNDRWF